MAVPNLHKPNFTGYTVRYYGNRNLPVANGIAMGVAFDHREAAGIDIKLDALPLDGHIVLGMNELKARDEQLTGRRNRYRRHLCILTIYRRSS